MQIFDPTDRAQFNEAIRQVRELTDNWHKKPQAVPIPAPPRQVSNLEKLCMGCRESDE